MTHNLHKQVTNMENVNNNNSPPTGDHTASDTNMESQQPALSNPTALRPPTPSSLPHTHGQSQASQNSQTSHDSQASTQSAPIGIHVRTTRGPWRGQHHRPGRGSYRSSNRGGGEPTKGKELLHKFLPLLLNPTNRVVH